VPKIEFVAEISGNHLGSIERAFELIRYAARSGASAVKLQTYKPETMTLPLEHFRISDNHSLWGGQSLYDLYQEAMTPWEWHQALFECARDNKVQIFSSPFDRTAVDFLEELECPRYKIASMETSDVDLISYAAKTGKPLVISTGGTSMEELRRAVLAAKESGCQNITLLLCTSSYPANPKDAHIKRLETLRKEFGLPVGLSDHTLGIGTSVAAIALGACMIEKHMTLKREDGGPDAAFSLEPDEFEELVREGGAAFESIGEGGWFEQPSEAESRKLRRSLFIVKDVQRGEVATRENVKALRPNLGGPIYNLDQILGMRFRQKYTSGTAAEIDCFE
jgi:N-acetylneuraminate synthase